MRFADVIAPHGIEEFSGPFESRRPTLIKGSADKFADLYGWDQLNALLSNQRHSSPRVRLERAGTPARDLTLFDQQLGPRHVVIQRVLPELLYGRLREGATLVVDAVHETDIRLRLLLDEVAHLFANRAVANLYCSFGHDPGFGMHWDTRDVFALQVEGRKRWCVYEPKGHAPLYRDYHGDHESAPGELILDVVVERGDVLYVPRGWWHNVVSVDEPSVHITVGAEALTGIDYVHWLADVLAQESTFRYDLPMNDPDQLRELTRVMAERLAERALTDDLLRFVAHQRTKPYATPTVSLPEGVGVVDRLSGTSVVRWIGPPPVIESDDANGIVFRTNGKRVTLAAVCSGLVHLLSDQMTSTIADLAGASGLTVDKTIALVGQLAQTPVIAVLERP